jgi:iron(III) transport system substrate-binding protein
LQDFIKAGIHFEFPQFADAPAAQGGGFGVVGVLNRAPHPNAARVFANWIASKDGLTLYSKTQLQAPARNDIEATWLPEYLIPKPGVKYLDTYEYVFETGQRLDIRDFYTKLLR